MNEIISGYVWVGRDNLTAYDIISQERKNEMLASNDREIAGKYVFESVDPEFSEKARAGEYNIVVAGTNFGGGGKSIELPVHALLGANVDIVIAESFGRFFYRNAINIGMPVMVCEGITKFIKTGEKMRINTGSGLIENLSTGQNIQGMLLNKHAQAILQAGGYVEYVKQRLASKMN